jgi:hypothetical protein
MSTHTMKKVLGMRQKEEYPMAIPSKPLSRLKVVPIVFLNIFSHHPIRAKL